MRQASYICFSKLKSIEAKMQVYDREWVQVSSMLQENGFLLDLSDKEMILELAEKYQQSANIPQELIDKLKAEMK